MGDVEHHFALVTQARDDRHQAIDFPCRQTAGGFIEGDHVGATGQRLGDFHQLALAQGQAPELLVGIDLIGQALETGQRLLAQQTTIDHPKARRQMPEEKVFRHAHFRHQMQFLMDHRDPAGDAVGSVFEGHGLIADLHRTAARQVGAAEDFQQGRLARAVLAHQRVHRVRPRFEADLRQRLDPGKLLANAVETQGRGGHFHRPILLNSSLKLARVIRVTLSNAVNLAGSVPLVTHSNIAVAVL